MFEAVALHRVRCQWLAVQTKIICCRLNGSIGSQAAACLPHLPWVTDVLAVRARPG